MERLIDARDLRPRFTWRRRGTRPLAMLGRRLRRTSPRRALALVATLAVLGLGWLGLRSSPLVSVTHVRVSGVHGLYAARIERALTAAARRQSTMAVDVRALRAAVARFGVVSDLHVSPAFPHTLRITVSEQLPVATLVAPDGRAAVAADGTVLDRSVSDTGTPAIPVPAVPYRQVSDPHLLAELRALAPAPAVLLRRVTRVFVGPEGLTVALRSGLRLYFGDASLAHAKWVAAALVIADPSSAGAAYVDVRLPDRPTAGGMPAVAPGATTASGASTTGPSASTQAGLVATLAAALAGSTGASAATGTTPAAPAATPSSSAPTASPTAPGTVSSSTGG